MSDLDAGESSYGLISMMRDSLTAPVRPYAVFDSLTALAPPAYPVMAANLALFTGLALFINIAHAVSLYPVFFGLYGNLRMIVGGSLLLVFLVMSSILAAALLHGLTRLCGGSGGFKRSYQIVSMASSFSVLKALLEWFPSVSFAAFVVMTITVVVGVQCLHSSSKAATWAVFSFLGLSAISGQWLIRQALERRGLSMIPAGPPTRGNILPPEGQESVSPSSLQSLRPGDLPLGNDPFAEPESEEDAAVERGMRPPAGFGRNNDPVSALGPSLAQANQLLNNPALLQGMPPAQAAKMKEFIEFYNQAQKRAQSGQRMSRSEQEELAKKSSQLMMEMMQSMSQLAPPSKSSDKKERKP